MGLDSSDERVHLRPFRDLVQICYDKNTPIAICDTDHLEEALKHKPAFIFHLHSVMEDVSGRYEPSPAIYDWKITTTKQDAVTYIQNRLKETVHLDKFQLVYVGVSHDRSASTRISIDN